MSRTEAEILEQALRHLHRIRDYALLDTTDDVVIDAIALRLAAAIDALARLPQATAHELFGADWPAMRGCAIGSSTGTASSGPTSYASPSCRRFRR